MGHESEILDLILSSAGKAAPYMTEKLSKIGDGSMAEGISELVEFGAKSGMDIGEKNGLKKGVVLGALGTFTIWGAVKIVLDFRQRRIERITALQEADSRMKIADIETEFTQADAIPLCHEEDEERKDGEEVQN